jgi:hypothetical protein
MQFRVIVRGEAGLSEECCGLTGAETAGPRRQGIPRPGGHAFQGGQPMPLFRSRKSALFRGAHRHPILLTRCQYQCSPGSAALANT